MSLVGTWQREAARFAPELRVHAHHGPGRRRGEALADQVAGVDLVVTTYGTATRDADDLAGIAWRRLVLDEAQAVKNSRAAHARAVRRFDAEHRVALTGTPVENRLGELWSIMDVLNPGLLGTADRFRARYAIPVERHADVEAAALLRRVTRPYLLRRVKTDPTIIDDLPEKIEITQHYRLTREQASLYRTVVDDMMEKIEGSDGIERRGNVLAAMAKLKQVCNHPAQLLHDGSAVGRRSGKVIRLEEILGEILDEGDRVLCFTQFTEFGHLLVPHLSARFDTDVAFLHGGTPKKRRDELVTRFQDGAGPPIMLLSLKAGGTGLTLTAANHVVHLDRWWNPAVEDQATDRAFRIGQHRNVQVRKFVCPGTVEERIDDMITKKKALSQMVVGDGEGWLTELSTDSAARGVRTGRGRAGRVGARGVRGGGLRCLTRSGGATPSRPVHVRWRAASRSTARGGRWRARGGRGASSRCWRRSGSAGGSPVAAPTPGPVRSSRSTSTREALWRGCRAAGRSPTGCGSACRRSGRSSGPRWRRP